MKNKIEDIFLTYANYSLRDDPHNLKDIFLSMAPFFHPDSFYKDDLDYLIKRIVVFAKCADYKKAKKEKEHYLPGIEDCAFEAIFGYRNGFCELSCAENTGWDYSVIEKIGLNEKRRLNCLECGQIRFRNILSEIIIGKKYNEISWLGSWTETKQALEIPPIFLTLIQNAHAYVDVEFLITEEKISKRESIKINRFLYDILDRVAKPDPRFKLESFLHYTSSYSLFEFLRQNDRKLLKQCPVCEQFFIAQRKTKKYCSDRCKDAYWNRKKIDSGYLAKFKRERKEKGLAAESYWG